VVDGRCFATPFLGTREFSAAFGPPDASDRPIAVDADLGLMLGDMTYGPQGEGTPRFFAATLEGGVLRVPTPETMG
jgi:CRISPR-associated protein Cas5d